MLVGGEVRKVGGDLLAAEFCGVAQAVKYDLVDLPTGKLTITPIMHSTGRESE